MASQASQASRLHRCSASHAKWQGGGPDDGLAWRRPLEAQLNTADRPSRKVIVGCYCNACDVQVSSLRCAALGRC
eukprot:6649244-Alexandrium_andersonii.AAC.1